MTRTFATLPMMALALSSALLAMPASARTHGHSATTIRANGSSVNRQRMVTRTPGSVSADRSVQGSYGRGYQTSRDRSCANGTCTAQRSLQTNNGTTISRSGSVTANGDGTATYNSQRVGANGQVRSVSGTVSRGN